MSTAKTIKAKNLPVPNPQYSPKAGQHATTLAVVLYALLKLGVI